MQKSILNQNSAEIYTKPKTMQKSISNQKSILNQNNAEINTKPESLLIAFSKHAHQLLSSSKLTQHYSEYPSNTLIKQSHHLPLR